MTRTSSDPESKGASGAESRRIEPQDSPRRLLVILLLAWVATLGLDFFLHGGLFAGVFFQNSPFLLPPEELFLRIPLGYLSFLLMTGLLVWLMTRLSIVGARSGAMFGLGVGLAVIGSGTLGLASVSTARLEFLVVWFVSQSLLSTVAGAVIGRGLLVNRLRGLALLVLSTDLGLIALTVILQTFEFVPTAA